MGSLFLRSFFNNRRRVYDSRHGSNKHVIIYFMFFVPNPFPKRIKALEKKNTYRLFERTWVNARHLAIFKISAFLFHLVPLSLSPTLHSLSSPSPSLSLSIRICFVHLMTIWWCWCQHLFMYWLNLIEPAEYDINTTEFQDQNSVAIDWWPQIKYFSNIFLIMPRRSKNLSHTLWLLPIYCIHTRFANHRTWKKMFIFFVV